MEDENINELLEEENSTDSFVDLYAKEKAIYEAYIEGKLTIGQIAKKFSIKPESTVEIIAGNYAKYILDDMSAYYKAKLKRKKEQEEKEKKEQVSKDKNGDKEKEIYEKAKECIKAFLESDLDKKEFCKQNKMSYNYFNHQLAIVYNYSGIDKKESGKTLYKAVKKRYYSDYLDSLKEDEEKLSEEEYNLRVDKAEYLMSMFVFPSNDKYTEKEFCERNSMSEKYFESLLRVLKDEDTDLYEQVRNRIQGDVLRKSSIFGMLIEKTAKVIKQKAEKKEPFTIYDYYTVTKVDINKMIEYAQVYNLPSNLYRYLEEFRKDNEYDLKDITVQETIKMNLVDAEQVDKIFEYLETNEYPITIGTVRMAVKRQEKKDKEIDNVDDVLIKDLIRLSDLDEAQITYDSIKASTIQKNERLEQEKGEKILNGAKNEES